MKKGLYYIDCITNLHVGSGDINYNIIDKEVEKDPITENPVIHASGVKGALRDWAKKKLSDDEKVSKIFGAPCTTDASETSGTQSYFNAQIICRPMRACGTAASIKVTTLDALRNFVNTTAAFGFDVGLTLEDLGNDNFVFDNCNFLVSSEGILSVEGEKVKSITNNNGVIQKIKAVIGDDFAIVKSFSDYDLPVIARNNLQMKSGGLWYEEYVPYGSRFYIIILSESNEIEAIPEKEEVIQIGGNSSIGYGYCKFVECQKGE